MADQPAATSYRTEFPDFGDLDVVLPEGFADVSWRNDACPRFLNEELGLFIVVDYADAEARNRNHPDFGTDAWPPTSNPRFIVEAAEDGRYVSQEPPLLETDDWAEVEALVGTRRAPAAPGMR